MDIRINYKFKRSPNTRKFIFWSFGLPPDLAKDQLAMTDLTKKFSEAAKAVSSSKIPLWECVKQAYVDHLSDISTDDLPKEIQIFYDSVKLRITSVEPPGHIPLAMMRPALLPTT